MTLLWTERVPMLSINPDAATRDDVARMASELMEANSALQAVVYDTDMKKNRWGLWSKCNKALLQKD